MKDFVEEEKGKNFLDGSFSYEIIYMLDSGKIIIAGLGRSSDHVRASFLLHIRILYEFFYGHRKDKREKENPLKEKKNFENQSYAIEFKGWKEENFLIPKDIQKWWEPLNIFLAHLSYDRNSEKYSNNFPVFLFYNHFKNLSLRFLEEIDKKYLTDKLIELKEFLKI